MVSAHRDALAILVAVGKPLHAAEEKVASRLER
jgi:hypothetical protein